eukprot:GHVQ01010461.1.p2 GENE.GHVQ01010461.1~~GHVQ01010461.1.p2  ORF type:complete len:117 (-),score=24.37 GHVQ01010461.1:1615-1965(-)
MNKSQKTREVTKEWTESTECVTAKERDNAYNHTALIAAPSNPPVSCPVCSYLKNYDASEIHSHPSCSQFHRHTNTSTSIPANRRLLTVSAIIHTLIPLMKLPHIHTHNTSWSFDTD